MLSHLFRELETVGVSGGELGELDKLNMTAILSLVIWQRLPRVRISDRKSVRRQRQCDEVQLVVVVCSCRPVRCLRPFWVLAMRGNVRR